MNEIDAKPRLGSSTNLNKIIRNILNFKSVFQECKFIKTLESIFYLSNIARVKNEGGLCLDCSGARRAKQNQQSLR